MYKEATDTDLYMMAETHKTTKEPKIKGHDSKSAKDLKKKKGDKRGKMESSTGTTILQT